MKTSIRYRIDTLLLIARTSTDERLKNELCEQANELLKELDKFPELMDPDHDLFIESDLRLGIKTIISENGEYIGGSTRLREMIREKGYKVFGSPTALGRNLTRWKAYFLNDDNIRIEILPNGSGGARYRIFKEDGEE